MTKLTSQTYLTGTWPKPRVLEPCLICRQTSPGHVLVFGIGQKFVGQICSTHTLWEVLAAERHGHELFNLEVSINDLDLAEQMGNSKAG